jgi:hypothetical protein
MSLRFVILFWASKKPCEQRLQRRCTNLKETECASILKWPSKQQDSVAKY